MALFATKDSCIVVFAVVFFVAVSQAAVIVNKYIMADMFWSFKFNFTFTLFQFVVTEACLLLICAMRPWMSCLSFMPRFTLDYETSKAVLPVTIFFCSSIAFTNICLSIVDVPLYTLLRSLVMLFTVLFSYIMLGETTTLKVISACVVVAAGFVLGSAEKATFSWTGCAMGGVSCALSALYGIYVKKVLPRVENSTWKLLIYNTTLSIPLLSICVFVTGEHTGLFSYTHIANRAFWLAMTLAGVLGFSLNFAFFLLMKVTSPLTINIAGVVKSVCQSGLSVLFFNNSLSSQQLLGLLVCGAGSAAYSRLRFLEGEAAKAQKAALKASELEETAVLLDTRGGKGTAEVQEGGKGLRSVKSDDKGRSSR